MKKTLLTLIAGIACSIATYSQETVSSSGDKKIFVGLAGTYFIADQSHFGAPCRAFPKTCMKPRG